MRGETTGGREVAVRCVFVRIERWLRRFPLPRSSSPRRQNRRCSRALSEERLHRKQRLASAFRIFAKFGFSEGVAGHITARDPELEDHFWVNPFGMHFAQIRVLDLVLVNQHGEVVQGNRRD